MKKEKKNVREYVATYRCMCDDGKLSWMFEPTEGMKDDKDYLLFSKMKRATVYSGIVVQVETLESGHYLVDNVMIEEDGVTRFKQLPIKKEWTYKTANAEAKLSKDNVIKKAKTLIKKHKVEDMTVKQIAKLTLKCNYHMKSHIIDYIQNYFFKVQVGQIKLK